LRVINDEDGGKTNHSAQPLLRAKTTTIKDIAQPQTGTATIQRYDVLT
jgi:hypothetical protein